MTKVTVRLYTLIKEKVGTGTVELDSESVRNVRDVVKETEGRLGEKFADALYELPGRIRRYYILVLNGATLNLDQLEKYTVKDGDTLHIFPPIAGG